MELECTFENSNVIVIDTGSGFTKIGYCGEDHPRAVLPTVTGSTTANLDEDGAVAEVGSGGNKNNGLKTFIGEQSGGGKYPSLPLTRGISYRCHLVSETFLAPFIYPYDLSRATLHLLDPSPPERAGIQGCAGVRRRVGGCGPAHLPGPAGPRWGVTLRLVSVDIFRGNLFSLYGDLGREDGRFIF